MYFILSSAVDIPVVLTHGHRCIYDKCQAYFICSELQKTLPQHMEGKKHSSHPEVLCPCQFHV